MLTMDRRHSRIVVLLFLALILTLVAGVGGCAQQPAAATYPTKAIDMVIPSSPGGGTDLTARSISPYVQEKWGVAVNPVNKGGGGGVPGIVEVIQAPADGYTVVVMAAITAYLNNAVQKDLEYQWDELTYLGRFVVSPLVYVVKGDSKYNSLKELADDIKTRTGELKYGSSGTTGPSTFAVAQLADAVGVDANKLDRVPFDGGAPTAAAVAGGHVDFAAQNLSDVQELVRGGNLKALAITTPDRDKRLADVPTTKEAGYPAASLMTHFGLAGPPNMPADIVKKWEGVIAEAMKDPKVLDALDNVGMLPGYMNGTDYRGWVESEYKNVLAIAERLGLRK